MCFKNPIRLPETAQESISPKCREQLARGHRKPTETGDSTAGETVEGEPANGDVSTEAVAVPEESVSEPGQSDADSFAYDSATQ